MTDMIPQLLNKLAAVEAVAGELNGRIDAVRTDMRSEQTAIVDRQRGRNRRMWIGLVIVAVVVAGLIWALLRQRQILEQQKRINATQSCVNQANDQRARDALVFYLAEFKKVNDQYVGIKELRDASAKGDKKDALAGFNLFLNATGHYRDGQVSTKLREFGVKVVKHADGTVDLIQPPLKAITDNCQ